MKPKWEQEENNNNIALLLFLCDVFKYAAITESHS